MKNDTSYGHIVMKQPKGGKMKKLSVAWDLLDGKPHYARGRCLAYETTKNFYRIYNPERLIFDMDELLAALEYMHRTYENEEMRYIRILEPESDYA